MKDNDPLIYTTENATVLSLVTNDGRDDSVKMCNGIGTCDYSRGVCMCPDVSYNERFLIHANIYLRSTRDGDLMMT